ncbi:MAG: hypothetical protein CSA96_08885 [Bacteroidetes bacterium]|nr:MAG: hypothetical protein CSA96_08885 [Bacteroidota bacterium]
MSALITAVYFLFPGLIMFQSIRRPIINRIGIVVICYATGILIGNVNIVPASMNEIQGSIMGISILLGIPLVLLSENVLRWARMAKTTFISLLLGVLSVVVLVLIGNVVFRERIPEIWKISGMMIGVYTGGTANLAAIAQGLGVEEELYILTHTVEVFIGAIVLLFLIAGAKPLFGRFLRPHSSTAYSDQTFINVTDYESYEAFFSRKSFPGLLKALGVALLIFGAGFGLSGFFSGDRADTVAILSVTTLGLAASLIPSLNRIKGSFQLGMYFIYVFCLVVASKADMAGLFSKGSLDLLTNMMLYIALVIFGSLLLHALLSWIFRISVDDFIISSTALSNSPPFVPVVAAAIRNKEVVVPGMIIGVIGYAIGNYLGVAVAYLLR